MARRDVDLVIRAKDEAAKVVDQITKALNEFYDGTKKLDQGAESSESALTSLGAAITKLNKAISTSEGTERFSQQLDKASSSLAKMEARLESTQQEAADQARALSRATSETQRYSQKMDGATAALERQKGAVAAAKKDQRDLAGAQKQAANAVQTLSNRQAKLPGQIEKQAAAVAKASARYEELSTTLAGTAEPTATLQRQFEASERSVTQKTTRLRELEDELQQVNGTLRAAGSAVTIFASQNDRAAQNLTKQERVLEKIEQNYAGLKAQTDASSGQQRKLQQELDRTSSSLQKQGAEVERAEASYVDLATSAGQADAAISKFADSSLAELSGQMREQRKATLEAKREWGLAERNVKELAQAIDATGAPTREMAEAFDRARARAATAKAEYNANRVALEQMGRAYNDAGRDIESISNSSQRFQQTSRGLSAELDRIDGRARAAAGGIERTDRAARTHTTTMGRLANAYREFYGDSRQSLSLLQRIRGEVLSLVAAYGGLFAAIETIRAAVVATETLAGVTARLNVAFGGDQNAAATELDFIRRQADRLGVSFTNLATEYSKFAVATKDTNLEGDATRRIFIGIAEAARVNRASQQELQGVFTALTQIVSKGAVQMEELRQQLGDRLPGAIQLMADALGVGTDELIKMMEQGMVTSDALLPFAEKVQERFGPGLQEALDSTAASIGRLQNAAFDALLIFSNNGFIEGFQRFVDQLTETLNSADFEAFAARAGAAMGQFFDFLAFGVENFDTLVAAATGFLALKLTPLVIAIGGAFLGFGREVLGAAVAMSTLGAGATGSAARMGVLAASLGRVRIALTALLSTTGIGLLVAAVGAGIALWATEADGATEALNAHEKIVADVKNAYDEAGDSVDGWAKRIDEATFSQALTNFDNLKRELRSARLQATDILVPASGSASSREEIRRLIELFRTGALGAQEYKRALEDVAASDDLVDRAAIAALQDAADKTQNLEDATLAAQAALTLMSDTASDAAREAAREVLGLSDAAGNAADAARDAAAQTEQFESAMAELRDRIPEVKRELEFLEESKAIEGFLQQSIQAASTWGEIGAAIRAAGQAQSALNADFAGGISGLSGASSGAEAAAALLRQSEGFIETPRWDVNAQRVGYGSDTITLSDGTIKKVTKGMRVSVEDANRDLMRRITTEFLPSARNEVGASQFDALTPAQQGVLTSITYNYGNLPNSVAKAVREGLSDGAVAQAIRNLGARGRAGTPDEAGARKRSNEEAAIFESGVGEDTAIRRQQQADEKAEQERQRAEEERQKEREATEARIADTAFEIEQQDRKIAGKEREAAIEAAIREAKAENPAITAEELALIQQQAGALFDKQEREKAISKEKEAHVKAEERVNEITQQRDALEQQRQIALEQGDTEKAVELKTQIEELNLELVKAIDNAIAMWEAVGGGAAEAAIAKLQTARLEAGQFGQDAEKNYLQWERVSDLFVNGLTNAFDSFAQAVAEGQNVGEAARNAFLQFAADFLRQIAQMIIQQAIFNALKGAFGGTPFGTAIGLPTGHTGGLVGSSRVGSGNRTKSVNPAIFASAQRYHTGGIVGLAPNEVPIIGKKGEEMLTEDDPRHMLNGGGKGDGKQAAPNPGMKIVNAFDSTSFLESSLATNDGQQVFMNFVQANRDSIKSLLGE